jgi:RND family efflux transporter MFP subunit
LSQPVTDFVEFTGTTAALESVDIRARVTGFLQEVHFEPRQRVEKDQKIYTIDPRPFRHAAAQAQAALAGTKAEILKAEFDLEKIEGLLPSGSSNPEEQTTALSKRDSLKARAMSEEAAIESAELSLSWCEVTSPIAGRISRTRLDPGNLVSADTTVLTTVLNDDSVYAYFNANEREVLEIRTRRQREESAKSDEARGVIGLPVQLALMTDDGFPHEGQIDYTATGIETDTGTLEVRAKFANESGALVPGLFVRLRVPIGREYQALMVSERALGFDQGQRYLLVVNDKNVVEYRPVKIGTLRDGLRVITEGIKPEDRVIVNGIQRVRPGVTVKPNDGPMIAVPAASPAPPAGADSSSPAEPAPH